MKSFFALVVLAVGLMVNGVIFAAVSSALSHRLIVDAGSSGSRIYLFEYDRGVPLPMIRDIFSESVKPGLSSYANNPVAAAESLKPLLDDALLQLQAKHLNPEQVEINVLATAGMRLLPAKQQAAIYAAISKYITTHYRYRVGRIETLPGKMEGLYGWLDINYLAKNFKQGRDATLGSLDMGGASTQIAFSTLETSRPQDEITLTIAGRTYTVYSKSFLGLGLNQALKSLKSNSDVAACFPTHYVLPSSVGHFNFARCSTLSLNLINRYRVAEQVLPVLDRSFIAYSGAYEADHFLGIENTVNQSTAENRIQVVCTRPWKQLKQTYPDVADEYLSVYCANATFMSQLFYGVYQIRGESQLRVMNEINHTAIDWALGALLYDLIRESKTS